MRVEHIVQLLDNRESSFELLKMTGFWRSFPRRGLDVAAANALRAVLANKSVPFDGNDEGTETCYRNGWLHTEPLDSDAQTIVCVFPTKLHEKQVNVQFGMDAFHSLLFGD